MSIANDFAKGKGRKMQVLRTMTPEEEDQWGARMPVRPALVDKEEKMITECKAAEETIAIGDRILAGEKVSTDDVVAQGYVENRPKANTLMSQVMRYLRRWHPNIPVGYVPGHNGQFGTYQLLRTWDERVATTRRSFVRTRGHMKGSSQIVANAPIGLSEDDKAGWASAVRPGWLQIMAPFVTIAVELIDADDPQAAKQLVRSFKRQLGAG